MPVQRAGAPAAAPGPQVAHAAPASMERAASHAISNKGTGEPLQSSTRGAIESGLGADLSDVRVHQNDAAREAASALNARAFTHQNDIWLGPGESQSDTRLMAHEATHVLQQTGSVQRELVQRADAKTPKDAPAASATTPPGVFAGKEGEVDGNKLTLAHVKIPKFKKGFAPDGITLPKKTDDPRPDDQIKVWEQAAKSEAITAKLEKKVKAKNKAPLVKNGKPIYFLKLRQANSYVLRPADYRSTVAQTLLGPERKLSFLRRRSPTGTATRRIERPGKHVAPRFRSKQEFGPCDSR